MFAVFTSSAALARISSLFGHGLTCEWPYQNLLRVYWKMTNIERVFQMMTSPVVVRRMRYANMSCQRKPVRSNVSIRPVVTLYAKVQDNM